MTVWTSIMHGQYDTKAMAKALHGGCIQTALPLLAMHTVPPRQLALAVHLDAPHLDSLTATR